MSITVQEVKFMVLNSPETNYAIVVFRSRQHALAFKDTLTQNGIRCSIIPTPKELSLGCGLSVKFESESIERVKKIMQEQSFSSNGMYSITIKNNVIKFVKIAN